MPPQSSPTTVVGQNAARLRDNRVLVFLAGGTIGILGGLIGLGGAEFRLPLLIGLFGFVALEAVILNKATSLVVVAVALPFRAATVPFGDVFDRWDVLVTLLAGALVGAWFGAGWATRLQTAALYRVLAVLLVAISGVLLFGHGIHSSGGPLLDGVALVIAGVGAGLGIGWVAALMGVAGGELLIPTIVLLFGVDVKLAGSMSLAVSLPTMIVGFARYSQDRSFHVIRAQGGFLATMAAGSIVGAFVGGRLLGVVSDAVLLPALAAILLISSVKVWRHA
jgi:uncharacterized membrane protein YfcA